MIAGKHYRCIECVRMVAHVNSAYTCERCVKSERKRIAAAHDEIVARINR